MVQRCQNHRKTIEVNGGLKKNINHSIALKNWPSSWSNLAKRWGLYERTLLLQEHLTVLKKANAEPKKGRSKKKAIIELHPWKMVWQNCPVSWKFWLPGVISLTMDYCSTQSQITPCNAALENHFELPNWSLKVVLHRPFLILRPMQNLV